MEKKRNEKAIIRVVVVGFLEFFYISVLCLQYVNGLSYVDIPSSRLCAVALVEFIGKSGKKTQHEVEIIFEMQKIVCYDV